MIISKKQLFTSVLSIAIGSLFIFSSIIKISAILPFIDTIELYGIKFEPIKNYSAILIISLELLCGIFLIINVYRKISAAILQCMLVVFIIAISYNLLSGRTFRCGCFGSIEVFAEISLYSIFFDAALVALLWIVYRNSAFYHPYKKQLIQIAKFTVFFSLIINLFMIHELQKVVFFYNDIEVVQPDEVNYLLDNENVIIFDARSKEAFQKEHIYKAESLPALEFHAYYDKSMLKNNTIPIVVYCDSDACTSSRDLAMKLLKNGATQIKLLKGGIEGWKGKKLRISS